MTTYRLVPTPGNGEGGRWPDKEGIYQAVSRHGLCQPAFNGDALKAQCSWLQEGITHWLEEIPAPSTPITPEALEAAGWKPHGTKRGDNRESYYYPNCPISVLKFTHWIVGLDGAGERVQVPNCKTMEQLHQLLEMMGAGQ